MKHINKKLGTPFSNLLLIVCTHECIRINTALQKKWGERSARDSQKEKVTGLPNSRHSKLRESKYELSFD